MFQYGVKRPVFDVLSPEGTDLSPIMSAIYLFLTMIIVFQVRSGATLDIATPSNSAVNKASGVAEFETVLSPCTQVAAVNQNAGGHSSGGCVCDL